MVFTVYRQSQMQESRQVLFSSHKAISVLGTVGWESNRLAPRCRYKDPAGNLNRVGGQRAG
jgi:hypothetical protein